VTLGANVRWTPGWRSRHGGASAARREGRAPARRRWRRRVVAEKKNRLGRKCRPHNAAAQRCVESGTFGGCDRARAREEVATVMRRSATPRWHMEPHHGAIVLRARSAASRHEVRHEGMTILDGVRNVFEVNCLICANRCRHRHHTRRPTRPSRFIITPVIASQPTFASANRALWVGSH
jgi:hypothetical protein